MKGNLWCREGGSNPQDPKVGGFLVRCVCQFRHPGSTCKCLILRPVYGSVPFSSKITNVQLYKKVRQFPQTSTVHCHFSHEALAGDSLAKSPLPSHKKAPAGILPL